MAGEKILLFLFFLFFGGGGCCFKLFFPQECSEDEGI